MKALVICRAISDVDTCECLFKETFEGCDVSYARSVQEGLVLASDHVYDVILIELDLLKDEAFEAINSFTAHGPNPPIIALTTPENEEAALLAVRRGVQDYLLKSELCQPLLRHAIRTSLEKNRCSETLRQTEEQFRLTFDRAVVGMAHASPAGGIVQVNRAFCQILGFSAEELKRKTFIEISHPDEQEATKLSFQRMVKGELDKYTVVKRYMRKDGEAIWVRASASMVYDPLRNPEFAVVIIEDITAHKRAEEALKFSEARFEALFRDNPVMIATVNNELVMLAVNPKCASHLDYAVDELQGQPVLKLFHPDDQAAVADQLHKCLENPYHVYSWQFRKQRRCGEIVWVEEVAQAVYDQHGDLNVLVVCQDITERKRAEDALQEALYDLERSNLDLEQFAYLASHDLKEPLRMITSFIQLLETKYRGRLDEKANSYIHFALDGAKRMDVLIEALLKYSRIGRSRSFGWVDTNTVLSDAITNLDVAIRENMAEIAARNLPTVWGDHSLLGQLFQNLLSNAIKYRRDQASPRISVSAEKIGSDWVFSFKDNGIGIESENFERIFQIFQRLHTQKECPGTGIGLASSKRIVEHHHGRIWVESSPEIGTTFFFTIPAAQEATPP